MPRSVKHGGKKVYKFKSLKNSAKARNRQLKRKKTVKTDCAQLKDAWDAEKTVKQNLTAMGLAYDPNAVIPTKKCKGGMKSNSDEMEVDVPISEITSINAKTKKNFKKKQRRAKKTDIEIKVAKVAEELEKAAAEEARAQKVGREHKLSDRDVEFCVYMYTKHKEDYKAMAMDKKNLWQETPKQIERKIRVYKNSPYFKALESLDEA